MEIEAKMKKQSIEDKKNIADQKQQMAIELANLQI